MAPKLIVRTQRGVGTEQATQNAANRLFRLKGGGEGEQPYLPLARDVRDVSEVTRGLGLQNIDERRVQQLVESTRAEGGPKTQTHRLFLATGNLATQLRAMPEVQSDARMEIARRARAYWMNSQQTGYDKQPTVRAPLRPQAREDTVMKKSQALRKATFGAPPPGVPKMQGGFKGEDLKQEGGKAKLKTSAGKPKTATGKAKTAKGAVPGGKLGGADAGGKKGQVSLDKPPAGFTAIPGSAKGGYHKQMGDKFQYWYPGVGITSTPSGADQAGAAKGKAAAMPGAKGAAGAPPGAPGKPATSLDVSMGGGGAPGGAAGAPGGAGAAPAQGGGRDMGNGVTAEDENSEDPNHHLQRFNEHKKQSKKAMRAGDSESAQAHANASAHHAFRYNKLTVGDDWEPEDDHPGYPKDEDGGGNLGTPEDGYSRAQSGVLAGEDGERQTAANPRERFMPESEVVKGMRQALGKGVNIMADLSAAHDHLSQLMAKRNEVKRSGHPMARRMLSQIDAEVAASKHDIVQLEEAHEKAMGEVGNWQAQMKSERIKANPIFQSLMQAFAVLQSMGKKLAGGVAALGDKAVDGAKGAIDALDGTGKAKKESAANFDQALAGAAQKDDLEATRAKALGQEDETGVVDANKMQRDAAVRAGASPDVLDALAAKQGAPKNPRGSDEENMQRVLAVLGEKDVEGTPIEGGEDDGESSLDDESPDDTEANAAVADLLKEPAPQADPNAPRKASVEADTGQWDADLKNKKAKIQEAESAEDDALAPYAEMDTMSRLKALKFGGDEDEQAAPTDSKGSEEPTRAKSGVQLKKKNKTEARTVTGPKKQLNEAQKSLIVQGSALLSKSEPFRRVLRIAHKADALLKAASAPVLVLDRRPPPIHFTLYGG